VNAGVFKERTFSKDERIGLVVVRAVLGTPLIAAIMIYLFFPERFQWMRIPLPAWLRWSGLFLAAISLVFLVWVHRALGKNFSTCIGVKRHHVLVETGPYGLIRHPMYSAYFILFLSAFLISGNWIIGASGLAVILLLMTVRLQLEEGLLVGRFGEAYLFYRERRPKFIPCIFFKERGSTGFSRRGGKSKNADNIYGRS
jgi:protein-S-isoprenylcysteine O-methyltransferase Ste14